MFGAQSYKGMIISKNAHAQGRRAYCGEARGRHISLLQSVLRFKDLKEESLFGIRRLKYTHMEIQALQVLILRPFR